MKTVFLLIFATVNLWLAVTAKPYPDWIDALDQDAEIELLAKVIEETGDAKVDFEELGNGQLPTEEPGNDEPQFQKPEEELEAMNQAEPKEDEQKINEKTGFSGRPNVLGDMVLTPAQTKLLKGGGGTAQAISYQARRWPRGLVPYMLHSNLNSQARTAISQAMAEFTRYSCIRFVERNHRNYRSYPNYVVFWASSGCYSYLGMIGGGQAISIGRGCEYKGIVQHEILHALGRIHEQSRLDRDSYVYVFLNHVAQFARSNFNKIISYTYGLPYDYNSVMHYGAHDFSKDGYATIVPRQSAHIGQRGGLSTIDWQHVRKAYCGGVEVQSPGQDEDNNGIDYP